MGVITIERKVLEKNDELAAHNRKLFADKGIFAINMVSSPGSGKTSLLETTLQRIGSSVRAAVVEGDVQTDFDAQRIAKLNIPVVQIVTNGGCHLEARLVQDALASLPLDGVQFLVIENVGNLVCPANYDLGEACKVVMVSTPEGEEKPLKYPAMFRNASVFVINKIDLAPYVRCDIAALRRNALQINPSLTVFELSCTTGQGVDAWCDWILKRTARS